MSISLKPNYQLECSFCGLTYEDDGIILKCREPHVDSLLCTRYAKGSQPFDRNKEGIFRYGGWLPASREFADAGGPITYKSVGLSSYVQLENLWVSFNGFWPERGGWLTTATFKELEAYSVLARLPAGHRQILVVASAGNTGAAFAYVCSKFSIPCLIIVPGCSLNKMYFSEGFDGESVKIVSISDGTYDDAIALSMLCSKCPAFVLEGGVSNVARRDGIGTTLLSAVEVMKRLPEFYFQAIGSGTGAIAIFETANRVIDYGGFGSTVPRLFLSQNLPFAPVFRSWKRRSRLLVKTGGARTRRQLSAITANVLSNARPPYSLKGGLYDCLKQSLGDVLAIKNEEVYAATHIFQLTEGIDLEPAAAVAVASLIKSVRMQKVPRHSSVLLHITGGGFAHGGRTAKLRKAWPSLETPRSQLNSLTLRAIAQLFGC